MRRHTSLFSVLALVGLLASTPAIADAVTVNAQSYHEVPSNEAVTVETFDDSEQSLRIKKHFEDELRAQGYTLKPDARLILSFEARDTAGSWSGGGPNRLVEIGNSQNHTGADAPDVRLNIFNSQRGGLLNPKRDRGITQVTPSEFRIDATLEDRSNGRRLWQGWSTTNIGSTGDASGHVAMVRPIVHNIGKTVRNDGN